MNVKFLAQGKNGLALTGYKLMWPASLMRLQLGLVAILYCFHVTSVSHNLKSLYTSKSQTVITLNSIATMSPQLEKHQ
jgi:hypothetical protein